MIRVTIIVTTDMRREFYLAWPLPLLLVLRLGLLVVNCVGAEAGYAVPASCRLLPPSRCLSSASISAAAGMTRMSSLDDHAFGLRATRRRWPVRKETAYATRRASTQHSDAWVTQRHRVRIRGQILLRTIIPRTNSLSRSSLTV